MTIRYFPYSAGAGSTVDEAEWSAMARHFRESGVVPQSLNDFEVYADSTGMQVKVKSGTAFVAGGFIDSDAEVIKAVSTADGSNPRIDRVILKVDWVNNTTTIEMLDGTPAASPSPTSLTQTTSVWEISLAQVYVGTGVSTINANDVTDERNFSKTGLNSPGMAERQSATIASGIITAQTERGFGYYIVTGEGSTDDTLTTINGRPNDGDLLILRKGTGIITITESGNITLDGLSEVVLRNTDSIAMFVYDSTLSKWTFAVPSQGGKKSIFLPAMSFYPMDLNNTLPVQVGSYHPAFEFIDGADDYALVNLEMPADYDGGNLEFYIWWIPGTTGTSSVVWQLAVDMLADGEASGGFDDNDTVVDAAQDSVTEVLRTGLITLTPTWTKDDLMVLRVGRLGTNGSDTLAGTARLVGVKVVYNTNKMNQS